jgi:hypothetical protein
MLEVGKLQGNNFPYVIPYEDKGEGGKERVDEIYGAFDESMMGADLTPFIQLAYELVQHVLSLSPGALGKSEGNSPTPEEGETVEFSVRPRLNTLRIEHVGWECKKHAYVYDEVGVATNENGTTAISYSLRERELESTYSLWQELLNLAWHTLMLLTQKLDELRAVQSQDDT